MGLASGVFDAGLFSAVTLMVMVTTFMAPPLLKLFLPAAFTSTRISRTRRALRTWLQSPDRPVIHVSEQPTTLMSPPRADHRKWLFSFHLGQ